MKIAKSHLDQRNPQVFNPPALNAMWKSEQEKNQRGVISQFSGFKCKSLKTDEYLHPSQIPLSNIYYSSVCNIKTWEEEETKSQPNIFVLAFWNSGFLMTWHDIGDEKWHMGTSLIRWVWDESQHYSEATVESNPATVWNRVQLTVEQIKQSSLSSQDEPAQVSSKLWISNNLIFSLERR